MEKEYFSHLVRLSVVIIAILLLPQKPVAQMDVVRELGDIRINLKDIDKETSYSHAFSFPSAKFKISDKLRIELEDSLILPAVKHKSNSKVDVELLILKGIMRLGPRPFTLKKNDTTIAEGNFVLHYRDGPPRIYSVHTLFEGTTYEDQLVVADWGRDTRVTLFVYGINFFERTRLKFDDEEIEAKAIITSETIGRRDLMIVDVKIPSNKIIKREKVHFTLENEFTGSAEGWLMARAVSDIEKVEEDLKEFSFVASGDLKGLETSTGETPASGALGAKVVSKSRWNVYEKEFDRGWEIVGLMYFASTVDTLRGDEGDFGRAILQPGIGSKSLSIDFRYYKFPKVPVIDWSPFWGMKPFKILRVIDGVNWLMGLQFISGNKPGFHFTINSTEQVWEGQSGSVGAGKENSVCLDCETAYAMALSVHWTINMYTTPMLERSRNNVLFALEYGWAYRKIIGNIRHNETLMQEVLGTTVDSYYGFEGGLTIEINNIRGFLNLTFLGKGKNPLTGRGVKGLTGGQPTVGIGFQGDFMKLTK